MMLLRSMVLSDYTDVMRLLKSTPGIVVRNADSYDATKRYLERNPQLSFVAVDGNTIVGCIMAGHDGRRGYLQHLVVSESSRGQGLGCRLVEICVEKLKGEGIEKMHIDVLCENFDAMAFWKHMNWQPRDDILRFSYTVYDNA